METVDRSEIAGSKLNIYCLAPDAAKAVAAIKVCLREAKLDFTKLSIGVAPHDDLAAHQGKSTAPGHHLHPLTPTPVIELVEIRMGGVSTGSTTAGLDRLYHRGLDQRRGILGWRHD